MDEGIIAGSVRYRYVNQFCYVQAMRNLQNRFAQAESLQPTVTQEGKTLARPLSAAETLQAIVDNYETLHHADGSVRTKKERLGLVQDALDTCSAMVLDTYPSERFKIVSIYQPFALGDKDLVKGGYAIVEYGKVEGNEFSRSNGKYNVALSEQEVLDHSSWKGVTGNNAALLKALRDMVFTETGKPTKGMAFCVRPALSKEVACNVRFEALQTWFGKFQVGGHELNTSTYFLEKWKV